MSEALDHTLTELRLARIRQVYPSWIEQAEQVDMGYGEILEQLVTEELLARQENHLRRKMKAAGFPSPATMDQFDFSLHGTDPWFSLYAGIGNQGWYSLSCSRNSVVLQS